MRLLIVTQKVDAEDRNLGFFVRWIEEFAKHAEVTVIPWRTGSRFMRSFRYQYLLLKHLPQVDGVFFHMCPEYALAAHFLPMLFRVKTALWYVHKEVSIRLWLAEKLVNKIFTASKESCRLRSKKVAVVGHGIDTELFLPQLIRQSGLHLVTVGRISIIKDLRTVILGFLELKKRFSDAQFSLVGEPITIADRQYRDHLVKEFSSSVHFLGGVSYAALPALFLGHTVFVHASKTGSIDKAALEALAAGLPVFTSSEAFSYDTPGVTKFREGDPRDLAEKIARAFEGGNLVIGNEGRAFVREHHSLSHLVQKILSFYAKKETI